MNPTLFILIIALLAISLVLIVLGRRGRKINDHPQCTWCGFDLDGVYPSGVTCPECGAGLKRAGAIRQGVRRRMPVLVWVGGLLGAAPVLALVVGIYAVLSGGGIYRQLPTGILMRSVAFGSGASSGPIADELMNRLTNQAEPMSAEEKGALKDLILRLQGDSAFAWSEAWGDLFESLYRSGDASKSDYKQFVKQAMQLSIQTRANVELRGELPIALVMAPARVGSATEQAVYVRIRSVRLNDKAIATTDVASTIGSMATMLMGRIQPSGLSDYPIVVRLEGSAAARRGWRSDNTNLGWVLPVPKDAIAGTAKLELDVMMYSEEDARKMFAEQSIERQPFAKRREELLAKPPDDVLSTSFALVEPDSVAIEARKLDERDLAKLREELQPREISVTTNVMDRRVGILPLADSEWTSASMTLYMSDVKEPLAYEVLMRFGDRTERVDELVTGRRASPYGGWLVGTSQRFIQGRVRNFDPEKHTEATVIFRPRRSHALRTVDMTAFIDHELVYERVPIRHERMDLRQRTTPARRATSTEKEVKKDVPAKEGEGQ